MKYALAGRRWLAGLILLFCVLGAAHADAPGIMDARTRLGLTQAERAEFLAQMRQMFASVEGIISGIGTGDREKIASAARDSGNRMARATPASIRAKLPAAFKELGGPTHLAFEEIATRAESDPIFDTDGLTKLTGETLRRCMACHALFRAD